MVSPSARSFSFSRFGTLTFVDIVAAANNFVIDRFPAMNTDNETNYGQDRARRL